MSYTRDLAHRVRGGLKRRAKKALQEVGLLEPSQSTPTSPMTMPADSVAEAPEPVAAAPEPIAEAEPAVEPVGGLRREDVEELLEDMVRPALQSDGGDITLVRVDPEGDIYVELVGACSTCPSATVTMRNGIERLFQAELEGFRSLIEINGTGGSPTAFQ